MARGAARAVAAWLLIASCLGLHSSLVRYKVLDDGNFEHVTQAATGQTSGPWLVLFCLSHDFEAMRPHWDELAGHAQPHQLFLGKVELESSPRIRHRFDVHDHAEVLLFRHRKMYRWPGSIHDTGPIFRWATGGYASDEALQVPAELGPVATAVAELVRTLGEHLTEVVMAVAAAFAVAALLFTARRDVVQRAPQRARIAP